MEFKMKMAIDNPGMYSVEELQAMQREYDEASAAADKLMHSMPSLNFEVRPQGGAV